MDAGQLVTKDYFDEALDRSFAEVTKRFTRRMIVIAGAWMVVLAVSCAFIVQLSR